MSGVDLYKRLSEQFTIEVNYNLGFDKNLSPDVLEIINYLKGDLLSQDIDLESKSGIIITASSKDPNLKFKKAFAQTSDNYIEAFDKKNFQDFANFLLDPTLHTSLI